jgi:hypothetical protein
MGSFEGHVIPSKKIELIEKNPLKNSKNHLILYKGIAYTCLALWWGFVTAIKYARAQKNKQLKFRGSTIMPCFYCPSAFLRRYPIESVIKLVGLSFHIFMEVITGIHRGGPDMHIQLAYENAHHVMMISGFVISAIVEILIYYGLPLPKKADYVFNLLAFLMQVLIMTTHLSGDMGVEYIVHQLWTVLIVLTFVGACIETYDPENLWGIYMRLCFFLAQGTWLMQIAFVVWPHTTNPIFIWGNDHASHAWLSISLMIHISIAAFTLMFQYVWVYFSLSLFDKLFSRYELENNLRNEKDQINYKFNYNKDNKIEYSALLNEDENEPSDAF